MTIIYYTAIGSINSLLGIPEIGGVIEAILIKWMEVFPLKKVDCTFEAFCFCMYCALISNP